MAQCVDSVFANCREGAVVCLQSVDLASQCVRTPTHIQRQFNAHVQKTEYIREMAVRIFVGDLAKYVVSIFSGIIFL